MARHNRRVLPRGSRKGECTITPWDYSRLARELRHDPCTVLVRFPACNLAYLSQLEDWEALKKEYPEDAARILAAAAQMGIPEKPPKPNRPPQPTGT